MLIRLLAIWFALYVPHFKHPTSTSFHILYIPWNSCKIPTVFLTSCRPVHKKYHLIDNCNIPLYIVFLPQIVLYSTRSEVVHRVMKYYS
jgi:hypothetical protein